MPNKKFQRFVWFVLVFNLLVILWGAYVRASGSGAGCGNHWPLCNGEILPRAEQIETMVEFTHRVTSGLAYLLVMGMGVWAFRVYPPRNPVRVSAGFSMLFMFTEALVGAGLVLFKLVADNDSMARAISISIHLINTFILLGWIVLTGWYAGQANSVHLQRRGALPWLFGAGFVMMLVLGASGAVTALGDTLFPSGTLVDALKQDFSPTAHILIRLRILHPTIAVGVSTFLIILGSIVRLLVASKAARLFSQSLVLLVLLQLGAGLLNVYLLAPIWMQLVHLILSDFIWMNFVLLGITTLSAGASQAAEKKAVSPVREKAVSST